MTYCIDTNHMSGPNVLYLDTFPQPMEIMVNIANDLSKLIFHWTPASLTCPSLHYDITSNCGLCPNTTRDTRVVCTDIVSVGSGQCWFIVQAVVCGRIMTNDTASVQITVKGIISNVKSCDRFI